MKDVLVQQGLAAGQEPPPVAPSHHAQAVSRAGMRTVASDPTDPRTTGHGQKEEAADVLTCALVCCESSCQEYLLSLCSGSIRIVCLCAGSRSVPPHLGEWLQHQHCQGHPQTFHLSRASWHLCWSKFGSQRLAKDLFSKYISRGQTPNQIFLWMSGKQQQCSSNIAHCLMAVSKGKTKWE